MAIADMFLKVQGATGEVTDAGHKGEIDIVSWSWGMQSGPTTPGGKAAGRSTMTELRIVKHVDQSSPTLMGFLRNHKVVSKVLLTVRKAGKTPLEYFTIELEDARVTSLQTESESSELVERLSLGFAKVKVSYTPQDATGAKGGGANVFEADASIGT